jgi:hypothetical protein
MLKKKKKKKKKKNHVFVYVNSIQLNHLVCLKKKRNLPLGARVYKKFATVSSWNGT